MTNISGKLTTSVICSEVFDDGYTPSTEEINEYAIRIGIDPKKEPQLLHLAKDGLMRALPHDWQICYHEPHGIYYFNQKINVKQWDHPLDDEYKKLVEKVRKQHQQQTTILGDSSETSQPDSGIKSLQGNEDSDLINEVSHTIAGIMDKFSTHSSRLLAPIENRFNNQQQQNLDPPSITRNKRFEVTNYANNQNPPQISLQMKSDDLLHNNSSTFPSGNADTQSQPFKRLTLSGMGSMFLKTKKNDGHHNTAPINIESKSSASDSIYESPNMKQMRPVSEHIGSPTVKSILRDSSLTDVRNKQQMEQQVVLVDFEDRKSVRFNLDCKANEAQKNISNDSSDDDDEEDEEWDFMEGGGGGEEAFVKGVKLKLSENKNNTKPMLKSQLSLDEIPKPSSNKLSVLSRTFSSDSAASADKSSLSTLFDRQINFTKPLYEDTDSESDLGAAKRFAKKIEAFDRIHDLSSSKKIDKKSSDEFEEEEQVERVELRQMMNQRLSIFRKQIKKEQAEEESKIRQQMQTDLMKMKQELSERNRNELKSSELVEFKQSNELELNDVIEQEKVKFQIELNEALNNVRAKHSNQMETELSKEEEKYSNQLLQKKQIVLEQHIEEIEKYKKSLQDELEQTKTDLKSQHNLAIDEFNDKLRDEFESKRKTISDEHRASVEILQRNHTEILQDLERDLKSEEDLLKKEHATNLVQLKDKLTHELEIERQRMKESGENHLYEKIRCEKRLLEDKYRCLKEKYVRLKADVKMSLERRNRRREQQSVATGSETERSNSNKHSIGNSDIKSVSLSTTPQVNTDHGRPPLTPHQSKIRDTLREKSIDRDNLTKDKKFGAAAKYLTHIQQQYQDDTTSISQSDTTVSNNYNRARYLPVQPAPADNGNSDSEAFRRNQENNNVATAARETPGRQRKKLFTRMKSASTSRLNSSNNRVTVESVRPCTPVENLRRQLQKLEDLEDQFPDNTLDTTYHLRYPFKDVCKEHAGSSSELEFFKHRIHMERDSVRRAKESLRTQRTNFRVRQREIKQRHKNTARHTIDQLIQEEKELTEMEVNLHRTRALLGEKVIRLRHLEQSLQRVYEKDKPNTGGVGGGAVDDLGPDEIKCNKDDGTISDLSSHSSSGFSSTDFGSETNHGNAAVLKRRAMYQESSAIIQSLDNLNTEIREIWEILSKQQTHCLPPPPSILYQELAGWPLISGSQVTASSTMPTTVTSAIIHQQPHHQKPIPTLADRLETYRQIAANRAAGGPAASGLSTSLAANMIVSQSSMAGGGYTTSLVERTQDLRNWLRQAKNEHELLTIGQKANL